MKYTLTLFCLLFAYTLTACDFCGCYMGITPYDNHSSISVLYRYKSFNGYYYTGQRHNMFPKSYIPAANNSYYSVSNTQPTLKHGTHNTPVVDTTKKQSDYEIFRTAELRARVFIHKRIELNGIIPFVMNKQKNNDNLIRTQGIGDITLYTAYHLVSRIMTEKFQHRLILGAGLKLPVGDYYQKDANQNRIDYMIQPGTGSIDYLGYINYVFGYKKFGFNFNSTYKINGENYYHERIDNSSTNYLNIFFKLREGKDFKIFPSVQGYYEYTKGLYIDDIHQHATTMNIANAGLGIDLFYKNFAINTSFQLPIFEQNFYGNMANSCKAMVGLTYSFNQKKYLIKSKKAE